MTLFPRSLYGRAVLGVILPVIVMQALVAYAFFTAHWDTVTARMSEAVAGEVALATELYAENPTAARAADLDRRFTRTSELSVALERGDTLPAAPRAGVASNLDRTLDRALARRLSAPFWFDTARYPNHIDIRVGVGEGVLRFIAARDRVFAPTGIAFVLLLMGATVGLTLLSVFILRRLARPITDLAEAADAFGRGQAMESFRPSGATEVRLAGQSFEKMRERIERFVEQRTAMLAGVSHDLRTPLQRLRLHLAISDDPDLGALADLAEMEAMLDGYLDFARSDTVEATAPVALGRLVRDVARAHGIEDVRVEADTTLEARPQALRRAVANLAGNARKYADTARITLSRENETFRITVEDDGPGIPEALREEALKPFSRLDRARNQNVEGTGLGLAIARDIARSHGGTVRLGESEMGGLEVEMRLPG